jgi:hypothetical protein
MDHLLSNYSSDPQVKKWVDDAEIFIIPCLNPDGWNYLIDSSLNYPWWRKNMADNNGNGTFDPEYDGIDLNRNYDFWWEYGEPSPSSELYRGPAPFSEPEITGKRDFMLSRKPVLSLSYHSYGEYVGYVKYLGYGNAPDWAVMYVIANHVAGLIPKITTGNYATGAIAGTESQSPNWCYQAAGTMEILIETADVFIPSWQTGQQVAADNVEGALYLLERAFNSGITGHAWDAETGEPLPAKVEVVGVDNGLIEPRTCDSLFGRYFRLLLPDTYTIRAFAENTDTVTVENVVVLEDTLTVLDFELTYPVGVDGQLSVVSRQSSVVSYPNPFYDFITFEYDLENAGKIDLSIYNYIGQQVAVLVNEQQEKGRHHVQWNAGEMPAGIYFYRLAAGGQRSAMGKLVKY